MISGARGGYPGKIRPKGPCHHQGENGVDRWGGLHRIVHRASPVMTPHARCMRQSVAMIVTLRMVHGQLCLALTVSCVPCRAPQSGRQRTGHPR